MHIYSHHALTIGLLYLLLAIVAMTMGLNKRVVAKVGGWFRWSYFAMAGDCFSTSARNLIIATALLTNRFDITDFLLILSFVWLIAMLVLTLIGASHKRRDTKLRLVSVVETPVVDAWPPAPKSE